MNYLKENKQQSPLVKILHKIHDDYPDIFKQCTIKQFTTNMLCIEDFKNFCEYGSAKEFTRINTNKTYPNFFQKIYTAGNKEQFYQYSNDFIPLSIRPKIDNTFNYMFEILKKGIFVSIVNNTLKVYLPFNNANYTNDWGHLLNFNNNYKKMMFIGNKLIYNKGDPVYFREVNADTKKWYANYNMFRNEIYKNGQLKGLSDEGDKSIENFLELLTEVCYTYKLPDICFFINPRDYPVVKRSSVKDSDGFEHPYDIIFKAAKIQIPSMNKYFKNNKDVVPIFSQSVSNQYSDNLFPNDDDITRLLCVNPFDAIIPTIWEFKKNVAVFRGSATGSGITAESNKRLALLKIANEHNSKKKDDVPYMDVKITSPNTRLKLDPVLGYCDYIENNPDYSKKHMLTSEQQSKYKYIIHVEGHVAAFRLSKELGYGSLIIKIRSPWKLWFDEFIKPFDPEVPVNDYVFCHYVECDLDKITDTLIWCKNNDEVCKKIAENGHNFYVNYLSNKDFIVAYTANALINTHKVTNYEITDILPSNELIRQEWMSWFQRIFVNEFKEYYNNRHNTKKISKTMKSCNEDGYFIGLQGLIGRLLAKATLTSSSKKSDKLIPFNKKLPDDQDILKELINEYGLYEEDAIELYKSAIKNLNKACVNCLNMISDFVNQRDENIIKSENDKISLMYEPDSELKNELMKIRNEHKVTDKLAMPLYSSQNDYIAKVIINKQHYDKCLEMYKKSNENVSDLLTKLFCMVARYEIYSGNTSGTQGAVPSYVFEFINKLIGVDIECFASPLNCHFINNYHSVFYDTDKYFGSMGSIFGKKYKKLNVKEDGFYEVNPPFINCVMDLTVDLMNKALNKYDKLTFFIVVPSWKDADFYIKLESAEHLISNGILNPKEHEFIDGAQHKANRKSWKANVSSSWFLLSKGHSVPNDFKNQIEKTFSV